MKGIQSIFLRSRTIFLTYVNALFFIAQTLNKTVLPVEAVGIRTAERDFFIGFAFLKGMYVEKNTLIATEMITRAAKGHPQAKAFVDKLN